MRSLFYSLQAMTTESTEKLTSANRLVLQAQRQLRELALDFGGMQFASNYRQRIEKICTELLFGIEQNSEHIIEASYSNLQDALYELNQDIRNNYTVDEDEENFDIIRDIFTGDNEDDGMSGSSPVPKPRRPGPRPGNLDSAVMPPVDDLFT